MIVIPDSPLIERVIVEAGPDVADDWIAEQAQEGDIVVTGDIPLAARCVEKGASVIDSKGKILDANSIGMALGMRNLMTDLRSAGMETPGGASFSKLDRSRYLSALDTLVVRLRKPRFRIPVAP